MSPSLGSAHSSKLSSREESKEETKVAQFSSSGQDFTLPDRPEPEHEVTEESKMIEMEDIMGSEEAQNFISGPLSTV